MQGPFDRDEQMLKIEEGTRLRLKGIREPARVRRQCLIVAQRCGERGEAVPWTGERKREADRDDAEIVDLRARCACVRADRDRREVRSKWWNGELDIAGRRRCAKPERRRVRARAADLRELLEIDGVGDVEDETRMERGGCDCRTARHHDSGD